MVAPWGFADTVTPPIFSPEAAAMLPDRIASAARAGTRLVVETSAASRPANVRFALRMACLRWRGSSLICLILRIGPQGRVSKDGPRPRAAPVAHGSRRALRALLTMRSVGE